MVQLNINFTNPENPFKFTDPIRKFKENDPYHYEVDNIPIKQLEENVQWLKNTLESATVNIDIPTGGGGSQQTGLTEVRRENFAELKPFIKPEGRTNVVFVNPGRYTARINDAYDLTPLQVLTRITATSIAEYDTWDIATQTNPAIATIVNKLRSAVASDSLGLNGLIERNFVSPYTYDKNFIFNPVTWTPVLGDDGFSFNDFNLSVGSNYPNFFSFLWGNGEGFPLLRISSPSRISPDLSATEGHSSPGRVYTLQQAGRDLFFGESEFIKRWRGVARTAVVDIPEELSATVSNFQAEDFRYFNEAGTPDTSLTSIVNSRIDLLFIYSKPIDQAYTHTAIYDGAEPTSGYGNSFPNKTPRKIYKAQLGIVRGAGLEMSYKADGNEGLSRWFFANPDGSLGRPEILAQATDQLNTNLGFTSLGVHGSFPAPDDLMNISPLLAEWLPKKHSALVGQTILPLAYIVVRNNSTNNNVQVLSNSDIIDIRPFFRTTELAYNERAGIAAAIPSVSIMNPVATESYVKDELKKLKTLIPQQTGATTNTGGALLLRDQFNSINVRAQTNKLIQGDKPLTVPFGGRYFAYWPRLDVLIDPNPRSVTQINQGLTDWRSNTGAAGISDGVYKTLFSEDVRWFVFSLEYFPCIEGDASSFGTWKTIVGDMQVKTLNTFVQMAKDDDGKPLTDEYRTGMNNFYTTPNLRTSHIRIGPNFDLAFYGTTEWIGGQPGDGYKSLDPGNFVFQNSFPPANLGGGSNVYPGWKAQKDFDPMGTGLGTNVDYKTYSVSVRSRNSGPLVNRNEFRDGVVLDRLINNHNLLVQAGKSIDIKVVMLVSNRVMIKDIFFNIQNMRIG